MCIHTYIYIHTHIGISLDNYESMARLLSHLGRFLSRTGQNLAGIDILKRLVAVHERINPGSAHVASVCTPTVSTLTLVVALSSAIARFS